MGFFTASTLFARATALLFLPRVADCRLENGITLKEYFKGLQDDNLSYLEAQSDIIDTLVIGSIANYLSVDEYDDLMGLVMESYGEELVFENEIGRSFLNQKIKVYTVMTGASKESFRDEIVDRNSMLLNGAHHAREVTTISQTLTQFLSLLYSFETGDTEVVDLLEKVAIVFLPIINIDSVALIGNIYEDLDELSLIRKNRKIDSRSRSCASTDYGVDLNRNYSFKFAYDSIGSSGSPCEFDYRGTEAFSEPETQAIRRFL